MQRYLRGKVVTPPTTGTADGAFGANNGANVYMPAKTGSLDAILRIRQFLIALKSGNDCFAGRAGRQTRQDDIEQLNSWRPGKKAPISDGK
jgi:hypothetical protein